MWPGPSLLPRTSPNTHLVWSTSEPKSQVLKKKSPPFGILIDYLRVGRQACKPLPMTVLKLVSTKINYRVALTVLFSAVLSGQYATSWEPWWRSGWYPCALSTGSISHSDGIEQLTWLPGRLSLNKLSRKTSWRKEGGQLSPGHVAHWVPSVYKICVLVLYVRYAQWCEKGPLLDQSTQSKMWSRNRWWEREVGGRA